MYFMGVAVRLLLPLLDSALQQGLITVPVIRPGVLTPT